MTNFKTANLMQMETVKMTNMVTPYMNSDESGLVGGDGIQHVNLNRWYRVERMHRCTKS